MSLYIQKYGGTSVATIGRIEAVADHIIDTYRQGHQVVVVVSAMGQHTDKLKAMAHQLSSEPPQRELDMLLSVGERVSMSLLSIALAKRGAEAFSFTGSQCGILTTSIHGKAMIVEIKPHRLQKKIDNNQLAIVAGFQGMSAETYEITTLGRGGSDLSAVALSKSLGAEKCEIYKDVEGIYNADPRLFSEAKKYAKLDWMSCYLLSLYGANVLHDRACAFAAKEEISLYIRSSFELDKSGTLVEGLQDMETFKIIGVTMQKNVGVLQYKKENQKTLQGPLKELFDLCNTKALEHHDFPVEAEVFISQIFQGDLAEKNIEAKHRDLFSKLIFSMVSLNIVGYHLEMIFEDLEQLLPRSGVLVFKTSQCIRVVCTEDKSQELYKQLCQKFLTSS